MKNKHEKIRNIGVIYRQARRRAENLCRREFYPFCSRREVSKTVDKILKIKNSSVYVDDIPGAYIDCVIKGLCIAADDENVFLYSGSGENSNFYTAVYFAQGNVFIHNCPELKNRSDICIPGRYVIKPTNSNFKSAEYYEGISHYLKNKRAEYLADYLKHLP